jgi:hypothetical protein
MINGVADFVEWEQLLEQGKSIDDKLPKLDWGCVQCIYTY